MSFLDSKYLFSIGISISWQQVSLDENYITIPHRTDPVTESTSPGITLLFNAGSYEKKARSMPGQKHARMTRLIEIWIAFLQTARGQ